MFARFAAAPIGFGLAALDGGLTLTTTHTSTAIARMARGDMSKSAGVHGVEFVSWGEAPLKMAIGVVLAGSSLQEMLGEGANAVGWRLETGEVYVGGAVVAAGIDAQAKGAIVGVLLDLDALQVKFYAGSTLVHTQALPTAGDWYFAVSMGSKVEGALACALNAGQWIPAGPAAAAGWQSDPPASIDVRLADLDYLTHADDTPAHARYEALIAGAGIETFQAMHFWPWAGSAPTQGGNAEVAVLDPDGLLDTLASQDIDGVEVELRAGTLDGTLASSSVVARYRADQLEVVDDMRKSLHLRDAHDALDRPLARAVFLPSTPALAWQPVPVVIGAVASVPARAAVTDGSVAFLCDSALAEVSAVFDRGDPLDDADWSLDPTGQQLLLANSPLGPVVVDASSIAPEMAPATLQQALSEIFQRARISAWNSSDAATIDAATGYAGIGYYAGDQQSCRTALQAILPSYGAWWYTDTDGAIRIVRAIDPDSVADEDLAFDLAEVELAEDPVMVPDRAPNLSRRMAYRPNAYVHGVGELVTDLVDVTPQRRIALSSAYQGQVYSNVAMAVRYRHADSAPPLVSCFWNADDARAELNRVCALYGVPRFFYRWRQRGALALAPKPGSVGRITFPRYGLEVGRKVLVRDVQRNPGSGDITLTLWGA